MGFFDTLFRRPERSSDLARDRLLKVLVDDRYKLTPDMMAQMKADLSEVLARYLPGIDPDAIEVTVMRGDRGDRLQADVPLRQSAN